MNKLIKQLNRVDCDRVDFNYIKDMMAKLTNGLTMVLQNQGGVDSMYRVRRFAPIKVSNVSEVFSPPSSAVINYQRCNSPGEPKFYAASTRMAAIKESRAEVGEIVYLGQWINHGSYPVNVVLTSQVTQHDFVYEEVEKVLYPYFDALFTRRIHNTFSNDYKLTAALAQQLMTGVSTEIKGVGKDGLVALKYPSVANLGSNVHNTVMHPEFASARMQLMHLIEAEVICVDERISLKVMDTATNFRDGIINWTGNPNNLPLMRDKDGCTLFINLGGYAGLVTIDHEPEVGYIDKLLME
jgi:RES domain.